MSMEQQKQEIRPQDDDLEALLNDADELTPDDRRRIRRAEALTRVAQQDFQQIRTRTVGAALRGYPLSDGARALVAYGGGPAPSQELWARGLLS
jgi:hypothetical protein